MSKKQTSKLCCLNYVNSGKFEPLQAHPKGQLVNVLSRKN